MITHPLLDFKRLYKLIMIDLKSQANMIAIITAAIVLLQLFMPFSEPNSFGTYFFILYCGGFVITARIFSDLHNPQQAYLFLMLPCSNLERFLSKWLLSSIGYAVGTLVICFLFSVLCAVSQIFTSRHPLDITQADLWVEICKYIILQAVVLLGAITFKSHALIKTGLVVGCFFLMLGLFTFFVGVVVFYPNHLLQGANMIEASIHGWNFIFWMIVAPVCWYLTYLRMTEYELK